MRTVPMSHDEVARKILNDKLDAAASENSVTWSIGGSGLFLAVDSKAEQSCDFNRQLLC